MCEYVRVKEREKEGGGGGRKRGRESGNNLRRESKGVIQTFLPSSEQIKELKDEGVARECLWVGGCARERARERERGSNYCNSWI